MPSAGESVIAGRMPGERIATDIDTADSGTITTTETVVMTVVAALVTGRIYKVTHDGGFNQSVNTDQFTARIREDTVAGTQLTTRRMRSGETADGPFPVHVEVEYTAVSTGNKTFVATYQRIAGTGNIVLDASAGFPSYLYVDYSRG